MKAMIDRICVHFRRGNVLADGIEVYVVVVVNPSAAELDRGYVTFTGRPEAHYESL
jgi:hypothetical protein